MNWGTLLGGPSTAPCTIGFPGRDVAMPLPTGPECVSEFRSLRLRCHTFPFLALIITNTILGAPYYDYSIIYTKTLFLISAPQDFPLGPSPTIPPRPQRPPTGCCGGPVDAPAEWGAPVPKILISSITIIISTILL